MVQWVLTDRVDLSKDAQRQQVGAPEALMLPGDNEAHRWEITVLKSGEAADLTGASVAGYFLRSDGETVMVVGSVTDGNVVNVTLAQECYASEGLMRAIVRVTQNGAVTTVIQRLFRVQQDIGDQIIDPGEVIPDIDELLAQIAAMEAATAAANAAAAAVPDMIAPTSELKSALDIKTVKSKNILDTNATGWEEGAVSSTGNVVTTGYDGVSTSPFIAITPGENVISTRVATATTRMAMSLTAVGYYMPDFSFISRATGVSTFSAPSGAKYIRISGPTAYLQTSPATYKPMLNYGTSVDEYEEYFPPYQKSEVIEELSTDVTILKNAIPVESGEIVCWGDSLTYGSGSTSGNSYPDKLAQMTGKVVHKCGFPADSSDEIAGYQGSMPLVIAPVTIPVSGSVDMDVYAYNRDPNGYPFGYPTIDAGNINPVTIAGIEGTLDLSAAGANTSNRTFSFTRSTSGSAVTLIDYTEVMPKNAIDRCKDIQIIWVGSNGGWNLTNSTLISQIRNMVEFQQSTLKKYIVIGFAAGIEVSYAISFARDATLAFGNHFIDMRDYLVRCGLAENGITPTEQDTQDIAAGKVPSSLRINPYTHTVDSVHLNNAGYNSVASAVYTRGKILGYWG